ncbi:MAG: hypothetical protein E7442_04070 [Ruminococcaceae bacterium]|nr:hypothetical protein [Oscillospiraceae bacterium]
MIVYVDSDFKCHVSKDGTMAAVETGFFDGRCDTFVEGYRFVPAGESWMREDGVVFEGEMITPWKDYSELDEAQREYEREQLAEYREALEMIFAGVTE